MVSWSKILFLLFANYAYAIIKKILMSDTFCIEVIIAGLHLLHQFSNTNHF